MLSTLSNMSTFTISNNDSSTITSANPPHLKEDNYHLWEPLMAAYLRSCGEYCLVSGMLQRPSPPCLLVAAIDTQGNGIAFTVEQQMHNPKLQTSYNNKMEKYSTLHEKACGDIMKFIAPSQRVHVKGLEGNAPGVWAALIAVHLQQAPGTRFCAYNELFSTVKGPNELLTHLGSRVSDAMGRIQELRPATNFDIVKLNKELQLMAMLRALPCAEYGDFTSSLMRTEELTLIYAKGLVLPGTGTSKSLPDQQTQQQQTQLQWWTEQRCSAAWSSRTLHQCPSSPHSQR
jgi:hypothetical protein